MIVGTVQLVETLRTVMKLAPAPAPHGLGRGLARQSLAWAPRRPAYDFLAFRGEPEPAANPVEQWHTQLGFERLNLTRSCWLAQWQLPDGEPPSSDLLLRLVSAGAG
jgi:hypothetical protein